MYGGNNVAMQPPWSMPPATLGQSQIGCDKVPETRIAREVPDQMERLEKAAYFAEESLNELVSRLEDVLRPVQPDTACGSAVAPAPSTPHGGHLFSIGSRVGRIGERLQDVIRRLEV